MTFITVFAKNLLTFLLCYIRNTKTGTCKIFFVKAKRILLELTINYTSSKEVKVMLNDFVKFIRNLIIVIIIMAGFISVLSNL